MSRIGLLFVCGYEKTEFREKESKGRIKEKRLTEKRRERN